MKKPGKKIIVSIFIIVAMFASYIALRSYYKPIVVQKSFENSIVRKYGSKETLKEVNVELKANLIRGVYEGPLIYFDGKFISKLEGNITIDNEQYYFEGKKPSSESPSIYGTVYDNKQKDTIIFMLKMEDLNSIFLIADEYSITGKVK